MVGDESETRICVKNLTAKCTEESIRKFFAQNGAVTDCKLLKNENGKSKRVAFVGFKYASDCKFALEKLNGSKIGLNKLKIEGCKKLKDLKSHPKKNKKPDPPKKKFLSEKIDPDLVDSDDEDNSEKKSEEVEDVAESGRLFIRNLSYLCTEDDLKTLLCSYGTLSELILPIDEISKRPKGYCFVEYQLPENAVRVLSELDNSSFMGRILHILPGKEKADVDPKKLEPRSDPTLNSSYKKQKMAKMKENAGKDQFSWNSLFVGANAVAEEMSKRYNTDKAKIMLRDDAAIQLALGESQIVKDIQTYLEDNGVKLDQFKKDTSRSDKIILVKNLPSGALPTELRQKFEKFGALGRIIMPPSGLAALVEFEGSINAKKAFKGVAYSRFGDRPLYLEWAPVDCLSDKKSTEIRIKKEISDISQDSSGTMIFVKNVDFSTNEESLRKVFEKIGGVSECSISMRLEKGKYLSMGYGWVRMATAKLAQEAIKRLQGVELEGHRLSLKISTNKNENPSQNRQEAKKQDQPSGSAKIMVRNVPFQCQVSELNSLFSTFGDLKFCRMPKKPSGQHRGFAFVEFLTCGDAKAAFDALKLSTHMYGRRLVLEWADSDVDSVAAIRTKTKQNFSGKKRKFDEPSKEEE